MQISELLEAARNDYLDDKTAEFLWTSPAMLRYFTEAERQACNRADLIYDDVTPQYTQIKLVAGQASYKFHSKITVIERFIWNGLPLPKYTKDELDVKQPTWRTDIGLINKSPSVLVQGHTIRIVPSPVSEDILLAPNLLLETYRLPAVDITDFAQEPEIPCEYHRDLIYWVLHEAYKKQDADTFNQEKSDYYLARFTEVFGPVVPARVRQHQFETDRSLQIQPFAYTRKLTHADSEDW